MTNNQQRILDISKKLKLSHIGSNLSALPILEEIYSKKKPEDLVILCNAHSHLAHLVVQAFGEDFVYEDEYGKQRAIKVEDVIKWDIHCNRQAGCDASGGSLGHGLGIGIGYALADRERDVYVMVSDGSTQEGSFFEAIRIAKQLRLTNLKIYANFNSFTAVAQIDLDYWENCIKAFGFPIKFYRTKNTLHEKDSVGDHYEVLT